MDYTKYIQSINDDVNNQNNQKLLSSNPNYHIEKHISHFNYDDKTKTNVLSKLKSIIDSTTAMKVFNYLVSNNLINVFLESYDYLTTLRIYNPLTYTQIINYVIDYKKTNTEMDDILEEELNFLLDTRVSKKSLRNLRNKTNNPNSVRVLNKVIKNIPDKQSVKNMSVAKKETLIEALEQLPKENTKADEKEQIQDVVNADANNINLLNTFMNSPYTTDLSNYTLNELNNILSQLELGTDSDDDFAINEVQEAIETKEKEGDFDADEEEDEPAADEKDILKNIPTDTQREIMEIRERAKQNQKKLEEEKDERIRQRESNPMSKKDYDKYSAIVKAEKEAKTKAEEEAKEAKEEEEIEIKKKEKLKRTKKEMKETELMGSQDKPEPPKRKYTKKEKPKV